MIAVAPAERRAQAGQDRLLARYLRRDVMPYSSVHGAELQRSPVAAVAQLGRIPPRRPAEMADPGDLVLRPDQASVPRGGDAALMARLWWAQLMRRQEAFNRAVLEPAYKPVHWVLSGGVPYGSSAEDMERLAEIGRASLERAGLRRSDAIVAVDADPTSVALWQLVLGARRAGIATVQVGGGEGVGPLLAELAPTVVAGPTPALLAVAGASPRLRAVIATDGPHDATTAAALASVAATVIVGVAAPGARSMWLSCPGGGLHTWPATEVVESEPDTGELLWTPLQWRGSVLLRTRTGLEAGVVTGPCPGCGRTSPRVVPALPPAPPDRSARTPVPARKGADTGPEVARAARAVRAPRGR